MCVYLHGASSGRLSRTTEIKHRLVQNRVKGYKGLYHSAGIFSTLTGQKVFSIKCVNVSNTDSVCV